MRRVAMFRFPVTLCGYTSVTFREIRSVLVSVVNPALYTDSSGWLIPSISQYLLDAVNPVVPAVLLSPTHTMLIPVVGVDSSAFVITQFSIFTLRVESSAGVKRENIAWITTRKVARCVIKKLVIESSIISRWRRICQSRCTKVSNTLSTTIKTTHSKYSPR